MDDVPRTLSERRSSKFHGDASSAISILRQRAPPPLLTLLEAQVRDVVSLVDSGPGVAPYGRGTLAATLPKEVDAVVLVRARAPPSLRRTHACCIMVHDA